MSRPRKADRHLPPCVYFKHGSHWLVKAGKWTDIGKELPAALAEYGRRIETPKGGMAELIERAYVHHTTTKKLAKSTRAQYRIAADALKKVLAEFAPAQVKAKHIAAIKTAGAAHPNMTNRKMSFLRTVFDFALSMGEVDSNPCVGIKAHPEAKRTRYISDEEFEAIYAQPAPGCKSSWTCST